VTGDLSPRRTRRVERHDGGPRVKGRRESAQDGRKLPSSRSDEGPRRALAGGRHLGSSKRRTFHEDGAEAVSAVHGVFGGNDESRPPSESTAEGDRGVRGSIVRQVAGRKRPRFEGEIKPCRAVHRSDLGAVKRLDPWAQWVGWLEFPKKGAGSVVGTTFASKGAEVTNREPTRRECSQSSEWVADVDRTHLASRVKAREASPREIVRR